MIEKEFNTTTHQQGASLIEALVALLILAFGILGILGMQLSILSETRNSTQRAQAIKIIEDLSERIKSNPDKFSVLNSYVLSSWSAPTATVPTPNCNTTACSSIQQAVWDIDEWRRNVPLDMLGAQANTFISNDETNASNRRQLGVMISWRLNERASNTSSANFSIPFVVSAGSGASAIQCPTDRVCHLAYIQP